MNSEEKYLNIKNYCEMVQKVSETKGKEWGTDGLISYSFAFGYTLSNFEYCLLNLDLTDKQMDILKTRMNWLLNEK